MSERTTLPFQDLQSRLNEIDAAAEHLRGVSAGLTILSEELGLTRRTPANAAFWVLLDAADAQAGRLERTSDQIHRMAAEGRAPIEVARHA